jgi:putative transposase
MPPKNDTGYNLVKRGVEMATKGYTREQVINKLRKAEILLNQGVTVVVVSKKIGVSDYTYYRWRKE